MRSILLPLLPLMFLKPPTTFNAYLLERYNKRYEPHSSTKTIYDHSISACSMFIALDSAASEIRIHPLGEDSLLGHTYHIDSSAFSVNLGEIWYYCSYRDWGWHGEHFYDIPRKVEIRFRHVHSTGIDDGYYHIIFNWTDSVKSYSANLVN